MDGAGGSVLDRVRGAADESRDVLFRVARRDTRLASVRYRALLPACALRDEGCSTALCSDDAPSSVRPRVAIAVKPLRGSDAAWVARMRSDGVPTVVDLCDNIFVADYAGKGDAIADAFRRNTRQGLVTVPTEGLRRIVCEHADIPSDRVLVVPDIVECTDLLRRQHAMVGERGPSRWPQTAMQCLGRWMRPRARALRIGSPVLLWYGNHGATHARFGLDDLLLWREALREGARLGAQLWVVSNHRERFEAMRRDLPIRARYFEWTPARVDALLPFADICLVPNSMDAFSRGKSANRALKALAAGVPVVATPTPAMRQLEGAVWLQDPASGIRAYLGDPSRRAAHLAHARGVLDQQYSMGALRRAMAQVVKEAPAHG
jgi:hypothetical protein